MGEGGRSKGEEEDQEHEAPDHFSLSIDRGLIIERHGVAETKEDHEDEQENPSGIVEDRDKTHDCNGDEEDGAAPFSEEGIGDVAPVQLSHRNQIEGGDEETDPSGISDRMEQNIKAFRNLSHHQFLNKCK